MNLNIYDKFIKYVNLQKHVTVLITCKQYKQTKRINISLRLSGFYSMYRPTHLNTGQRINELENGPSSYRQKSNYFAWVFMKR